MAPAKTSSSGIRTGEGDCQGLEAPRPLKNAQKGAQMKTTTLRKHQETGRHRSR